MDSSTTRAETPRRGRDTSSRRGRTEPVLVDDVDEVAAETDWRTLGTFAAGLAIGALLGAGVALLTAPASGFETRTRIARRAHDARERAFERAGDQWDAFGERVRRGARQGRRSLARKLTRGRWRAEDAWERARHRADGE